MKLKILGSNSKGNCYILENKNEALIIEAGVSIRKLKKVFNNNLSKIAGCLVSHSHSDHAGHMGSFAKAGIRVFASPAVFNAAKHDKYNITGTVIECEREFLTGEFRVIPFALNHDVPCMGFLINHPDTGQIAFVSDTGYCEKIFPPLTHLLIECNYANDILQANIKNGIIHPSLGKRIKATHLELENCKSALVANDLSGIRNIVLIHLSDNNSDALRFKEEITTLTGKRVFVAARDTELLLN
jgi:phosphoribosyl 1,2-cyclic phosphodiesterase